MPTDQELAELTIQMHRGQWVANPSELAALVARRDELQGAELHRLLRLASVDALGDKPIDSDYIDDPRGTHPGLLKSVTSDLLSDDSVFRERHAMVFFDDGAEPRFNGKLINPSISLLGALEIIRIDPERVPLEVDYVPFDALIAVLFGPPTIFRPAKLIYEDGRQEVVITPLLYGASWRSSEATDTNGTMTRFCAHWTAAGRSWGFGIGQQDLQAGGGAMFGLGSVQRIEFPLDLGDSRFELHCRRRGLDPDEVRAMAGG